jgi:CRP-like cAMP-binding protein
MTRGYPALSVVGDDITCPAVPPQTPNLDETWVPLVEPSVVARSVVVDTSRIAAFPDFETLSAEELDELAAAMSEVEVEAGATVITLDDYGTAIYFIEQGEADVVHDDGEANRAVGPGDVIGEIGLLLTGQRTATVVARTPMRLLSLSGQDFDRIRARVPEVERSLRRLGLERAG